MCNYKNVTSSFGNLISHDELFVGLYKSAIFTITHLLWFANHACILQKFCVVKVLCFFFLNDSNLQTSLPIFENSKSLIWKPQITFFLSIGNIPVKKTGIPLPKMNTSETGTPGKSLNFKKVHKAHFEKLESIDDYLERKRKRIEDLTKSYKRTVKVKLIFLLLGKLLPGKCWYLEGNFGSLNNCGMCDLFPRK